MKSSEEIRIDGRSITVNGLMDLEMFNLIIGSHSMKSWIQKVSNGDLIVKEITITHADFVAVPIEVSKLVKRRPCFIALQVDCVSRDTGHPLHQLVLLRGCLIVFIPIVKCEGELYVVLSVAPRPAVAEMRYVELPKGTSDPERNFIGGAAQLLLKHGVLSQSNLRKFTKISELECNPSVADEQIEVYYYETDVTSEWLRSAIRTMDGSQNTDVISLKIVPLSTAWRLTRDTRSLAALSLYEEIKSK